MTASFKLGDSEPLDGEDQCSPGGRLACGRGRLVIARELGRSVDAAPPFVCSSLFRRVVGSGAGKRHSSGFWPASSAEM